MMRQLMRLRTSLNKIKLKPICMIGLKIITAMFFILQRKSSLADAKTSIVQEIMERANAKMKMW